MLRKAFCSIRCNILEWIKNNISKCSSWRSYVHKSFVDLNITPALKKILFKMLQNGFFTPLLLISKLSGSTWDLVILWNRRPPRHIINWFLNGHTKVVFLLFSHWFPWALSTGLKIFVLLKIKLKKNFPHLNQIFENIFGLNCRK